MAEKSTAFDLNKTERDKWIKNLIEFARPLLAMYVGAVTVAITQNGGAFTVEALKAGPMVQGGMVLYTLNGAYDLLTKWLEGKRAG